MNNTTISKWASCTLIYWPFWTSPHTDRIFFNFITSAHFPKNPVNYDILNFKYYIFGVSIQIFIEFELCPNFHILGSVRPYGSLDPNGDFVLRSLCQSLAAQAVRSWARLNAVELSTTHWVVLNRLLFSFGIVFVSLSVCQFVFHDKYQSNKYEKIQQGNLPPIQVPTGALGVQSHLGSFHLLLPVPGLLDVCRGNLPLFKGWFLLSLFSLFLVAPLVSCMVSGTLDLGFLKLVAHKFA